MDSSARLRASGAPRPGRVRRCRAPGPTDDTTAADRAADATDAGDAGDGSGGWWARAVRAGRAAIGGGPEPGPPAGGLARPALAGQPGADVAAPDPGESHPRRRPLLRPAAGVTVRRDPGHRGAARVPGARAGRLRPRPGGRRGGSTARTWPVRAADGRHRHAFTAALWRASGRRPTPGSGSGCCWCPASARSPSPGSTWSPPRWPAPRCSPWPPAGRCGPACSPRPVRR